MAKNEIRNDLVDSNSFNHAERQLKKKNSKLRLFSLNLSSLKRVIVAKMLDSFNSQINSVDEVGAVKPA